jgi:hypothetical protein
LSALHTGRFYPQELFLVLISVKRLSQPQGQSATGRIMSMKNLNDKIEFRTRDFPACSAVPQPTALARTPISLRHTLFSRTPLHEGSPRRRELYLTTRTTKKGQTSMPPTGFEPAIPASERPQTQALDSAATGIGYMTVFSAERPSPASSPIFHAKKTIPAAVRQPTIRVKHINVTFKAAFCHIYVLASWLHKMRLYT